MKFFPICLVCFGLLLAPWVLAQENPASPTCSEDTTVDVEQSAPPAILSPGNTTKEGTRSGLPSLIRPEASPGLPSVGGATPAPPPGGLLPGFGPAQTPGGIPVTPPSPQVTVRWKQFDLGQAFGYNPLIKGVVEYPEGWLTNVDVFNGSVVFAEDATGVVALNAYLGIQNPAIQNAEGLAQQIIAILNQNVMNLTIQNQEFKSDPQAAQAGFSVTYGRVILSGNYQGRNMTLLLQPYVLYAPMAQYSLAGALLCYAPQEVFQEKLQRYFNHMIVTFEKTASSGSTGGGTP